MGGDVTTVLVVDDNVEVRAYVKQHLAPRYRVLEAANGEQGVDVARRLLPDLVLSDVMMPGGMNGADLAREIRKRRPGLPVVLMTGYIEAARSAMSEGLEVLIKPFKRDALAAILDRHIARSMARAQ